MAAVFFSFFTKNSDFVFLPTEIVVSVFTHVGLFFNGIREIALLSSLSLTTMQFPNNAAQGGLVTTPESRH